MRIAFVMDRLDSINPLLETTSHLMYECNQRGHTVYFMEPHDLYIRRNEVVARMRNITVPRDLSMKQYWRSLIHCLKKDELIFESLVEMDAIFLRKDPPIIYSSLEYLDPVSERVFMINSTRGQIIANSKLYILNFPDIIPETHVSRDPVRLKKIIDDFGGAMVVKPLRRYGGEGVIKVSVRDRENLNSLIHYYVAAYKAYPEREPIMVQEYLHGVSSDGDVRILLLNGEILGAMRRKAQEGEFRTNIHAGATAYKHQVTPRERKICETIRSRLVEDGLYFVGIDIIEDRLVEINVLSPGGIPRINRLDHVKLEEKVIDFIEQKVREMKHQPNNNKRR
ncbi:MAG: glutathione synthase [Deltaproteobacteria bacterium]|nr:glutathione synthase [Deltaproteobacteria bacterium]